MGKQWKQWQIFFPWAPKSLQMVTKGRWCRYTKYRLRTRQIKMICQRKLRRNAPCEWLKLPQRHDSLSVHPWVYPHILYSFPPRNTWFITSCLCRNSLLKSWRATTLSLTTGLVARIQHSHWWHLTSISPRSVTLLQGAAGQGHLEIIFGSETWEFKVNHGLHSPWLKSAWGPFSRLTRHNLCLPTALWLPPTLGVAGGFLEPHRFQIILGWQLTLSSWDMVET